jgi:hypothetical protein
MHPSPVRLASARPGHDLIYRHHRPVQVRRLAARPGRCLASIYSQGNLNPSPEKFKGQLSSQDFFPGSRVFW